MLWWPVPFAGVTRTYKSFRSLQPVSWTRWWQICSFLYRKKGMIQKELNSSTWNIHVIVNTERDVDDADYLWSADGFFQIFQTLIQKFVLLLPKYFVFCSNYVAATCLCEALNVEQLVKLYSHVICLAKVIWMLR